VTVDGRLTKQPVSPHGSLIDPHNPANWLSYYAAAATGRPVGWVLNGDGHFFLDFDKCNIGGQWSPQALAIVGRFPGAMIEVSQSGQKLHIIGRFDPSRFNPADYRNKWDGWREFYVTERFIAFGPYGWQGDPEIDHTA